MPKPKTFRQKIAGKHGAQMKLFTPEGSTLTYEGPLGKELTEFIMMAMATDGRHTAHMKAQLVELTEELRAL